PFGPQRRQIGGGGGSHDVRCACHCSSPIRASVPISDERALRPLILIKGQAARRCCLLQPACGSGKMLHCGRAFLALAFVVAMAVGATAQQPAASPSPSPAAPPPASTPAQPASQQLLKPAQLEALVAPIALYPDALLANMLAAATYPLEVIEADRWIKEN